MNFACMYHGGMTNGDVISNQGGIIIGKVNHGSVLNVCTPSYADIVDVSTQDATIPNAGEKVPKVFISCDSCISLLYLDFSL